MEQAGSAGSSHFSNNHQLVQVLSAEPMTHSLSALRHGSGPASTGFLPHLSYVPTLLPGWDHLLEPQEMIHVIYKVHAGEIYSPYQKEEGGGGEGGGRKVILSWLCSL